MAIVDDGDIQIHLPVDKLAIETIPDDLAEAKEDAERIVRGYLAGVIPAATLATWITPAAVPGEVRAIAGRLCAAKIYRNRFSENSLTDPAYAQFMYDEAMKMLNDIIAGNLLLTGITDTTQFDNTYFEPNANSDDPKFTMSGRF